MCGIAVEGAVTVDVSMKLTVGVVLKTGEGVAVGIEQLGEELAHCSESKKDDSRDLPSTASCK